MRDISKRVRIALFISYFMLCAFYLTFTNANWISVFGQAFSVAITFLLFFRFWPKMKKSKLVTNKRGIIRVLTVFILGIFCIAFVWYFTHSFFTQFSTTHDTLVSDMESGSPIQQGVRDFFRNLDTYGLVLGIIILGYWVLTHSQKRGEPVVYG